MKFLLLVLCTFSLLYPMEDQNLSLDEDVKYLIQKRVCIQDEEVFPYNFSNLFLSSNYAEVHKEPWSHLALFELHWDSVRNNYFFKLQVGDREKSIVLNKDHEVKFFDGPNENNVLITDCGWYWYTIQDDQIQGSEQSKKKKGNSCWCTDCKNRDIKPYFVEFPIIDNTKHVDAVALYKKSNFCAVAYHSEKYNKILFFRLDSTENIKIADFETPRAENINCKKISFITNKTLLMVTSCGKFFIITLNEKGKVKKFEQRILDSEKKPIAVQNFALDMHNPAQMLMILANKMLVLGNLKERTYRPLLHNLDPDLLSFNKDTVAFKERDGSKFTHFNLNFIDRSMFQKLLQDINAENKSKAA